MKHVERSKVEKILRKIEDGEFDENDVDGLFMKLRPYTKKLLLFQEIADFVAHNDLRDRGIANTAMETMFLRMKFFAVYQMPGITQFDIAAPFPSWVKRLFFLLAKRAKLDDLRQFDVSPERLAARIENSFKVQGQVARLIPGKLSHQTLNAIVHTMSVISGTPIFDQKEVLDRMCLALDTNGFSYNREAIALRSNKITLCILLLMHMAEFSYKALKNGVCQIRSAEETVLVNQRAVDTNGTEVELNQSFGKLSLVATVHIHELEKPLSVSHTIMSTDLDAEDWCDEGLFVVEPITPEHSHVLWRRLVLGDELRISSDFRLQSIS